jgi:hypothetical protein
MDDTKVEQKVLISNLRSKDELDPNCKHSLSEFLLSGNVSSTAVGIRERGQTVKEVYSAGDLVIFNSFTEHGLVLQVQPDCLKVLLPSN